MTLKLTLDYTEIEECCGSVFYFDDWQELWELVGLISNNSYQKNSYHSYFIEEYEEKAEKQRTN